MRTITSIHDAIDALVAIIDRPGQSLDHFYNIGNPANEVSMRDLAHGVRRTGGQKTDDQQTDPRDPNERCAEHKMLPFLCWSAEIE